MNLFQCFVVFCKFYRKKKIKWKTFKKKLTSQRKCIFFLNDLDFPLNSQDMPYIVNKGCTHLGYYFNFAAFLSHP